MTSPSSPSYVPLTPELLEQYRGWLRKKGYSLTVTRDYLRYVQKLPPVCPDGIPLDREEMADAYSRLDGRVKTIRTYRTGGFRFLDCLEDIMPGVKA